MFGPVSKMSIAITTSACLAACGDRSLQQILMSVYAFVLMASDPILTHCVRREDEGIAFVAWGTAYRWSAYFLTLLVILLLGRFGGTPFAYVQF
jgi:hypothetical protein